MTEDGRFDNFVSNFERFGSQRPPCLDCEVGEPHVCPKGFKESRAQQVRGLNIWNDLRAAFGGNND